MKVIHCRDVGVVCDFVVRGETEQEILYQCAEHARYAHGMEISPELPRKFGLPSSKKGKRKRE